MKKLIFISLVSLLCAGGLIQPTQASDLSEKPLEQGLKNGLKDGLKEGTKK
jgi:hypothetical protein